MSNKENKYKDDIHSRPYPVFECPTRIVNINFSSENIEERKKYLQILFEEWKLDLTLLEKDNFSIHTPTFELRVRHHTPFTSYMFSQKIKKECEPESYFDKILIENLDEHWLEKIPGKILSKCIINLIPKSEELLTRKELVPMLSDSQLIANYATDKCALIWTDFRIDKNGYNRFILEDNGLSSRRAGRLVQRLIDIDTYRILALEPFESSRKSIEDIHTLDLKLFKIIEEINQLKNNDEEKKLLTRLTQLAVSNESIHAKLSHRLNSARAYRRIFEKRLIELRQSQIPGFQTISEFLMRRMEPGFYTCEAAEEAMESLSKRITRATNLMRTRVDVNMQLQNKQLLISMDKRAEHQLLLQETVEGFSVVAISYYLTGLLKYILLGMKSIKILHEDTNLISGLALPFIILGTWFTLQRIKKRIKLKSHGKSDR